LVEIALLLLQKQTSIPATVTRKVFTRLSRNSARF